MVFLGNRAAATNCLDSCAVVATGREGALRALPGGQTPPGEEARTPSPPRPSRLSELERIIALRIDVAILQKRTDLADLRFVDAMAGVVEHDRMPLQRHREARPVTLFKLSAELQEDRIDVRRRQIARLGMGEELMEDFAMFVIHDDQPHAVNTKRPRARPIGDARSAVPAHHTGPR